MSKKLKTVILGASGYTGAELVRLLAVHPHVEIVALSADRKAGGHMADVFPQFSALDLPQLVSIDDIDWTSLQADVVFCALPHGTTQEVIVKLAALGAAGPKKIIDLSADFRLYDVDTYAEWYGHEHLAPALQKEAVYGLTEHARDAIKQARLVACPGCYPTTSQLPLRPLLQAGLISPEDIIIDAKSGITGAGRGAKEQNLFAEVSTGIHPYGVASHRHGPEIEQGLTEAAGQRVVVNFTPHLMPMNRGILASIYVKLAANKTAEDLHTCLAETYAGEPFVQVLPFGAIPATRHVVGSNNCRIGVSADRLPGRAMLFSVTDNLVKGASGQAVQNMNLMFGLPETAGLQQLALFP